MGAREGVRVEDEIPDHRTNAWNTTPVPLRSTGEVQAGRWMKE